MINLLKSNITLFIFLLITFQQVYSQELYVEDFRAEHKDDLSTIQAAMDALQEQGHGSLSFDGGRNYTISNCIQLPMYNDKHPGRVMFIINGNGCEININNDKSCGFYRKPTNQKEALDKMMRVRFKIQDFTFKGGAKGVELCATYGSIIENCNFQSQRIAAIDIQFGLNTRITHCYATNCFKDSFILRTGEDWGGNANNSQSNHSIISSCRVYAKKGSESGFKILGSNGVVLENIISEGSSEIDYSVFIDKQKSTTVRLFTIKNFHLEHAPIKAGFRIISTGIVELDGLFYQIARKGQDFNLIYADNSNQQITLRKVPHFVTGTTIKQEKDGGGISWNLEHCHKNFYTPNTWRIKDRKTEVIKKELPYYFRGKGYLYQIDKNY